MIRPVGDVDGPESVHLASWPRPERSARDVELDSAVSLARRLVELGRAARAEARVKTRQPLSRALISSASHTRLGDELLAEVAAELNVGEVEAMSGGDDLIEYAVKANFRALGGPSRATHAAGRPRRSPQPITRRWLRP